MDLDVVDRCSCVFEFGGRAAYELGPLGGEVGRRVDHAHALGPRIGWSWDKLSHVDSLPNDIDVRKVRGEKCIEAVVTDDHMTLSYLAPTLHQTSGPRVVLHLDVHVMGVAPCFDGRHPHVAARNSIATRLPMRASQGASSWRGRKLWPK